MACHVVVERSETYYVADLIRTNWNTLIPYMEQIASVMQEKLEEADMLAMLKKITVAVSTVRD